MGQQKPYLLPAGFIIPVRMNRPQYNNIEGFRPYFSFFFFLFSQLFRLFIYLHFMLQRISPNFQLLLKKQLPSYHRWIHDNLVLLTAYFNWLP